MSSRQRTPHLLLAAALLAVLFWLNAPASTASPLPHTPTAVTAPAEPAPAPPWAWPLLPRPEVTRSFTLEHRYGAGHRGIDLAANAGDAVYAPAAGTVHFVGYVVDRPVVSIQHANGVRSTFEPVTAVVTAGDAVAQGQLIGHLAAAPQHAPAGGLHLGAKLGEDYLDPLVLLGAVPRAILLPSIE